MIQRNCKNCGAPLQHSYNHKCSYCGTLYDFNEPKEKTIKLKSYDLVDLKYCGYEIGYMENEIILYFEGYKLELPKIYEYDGKNTYVSSVETYINPPKCGFCICLDKHELEKYGLNYIKSMIFSSIEPSEIENILNQLGKIVNDLRKTTLFH